MGYEDVAKYFVKYYPLDINVPSFLARVATKGRLSSYLESKA